MNVPLAYGRGFIDVDFPDDCTTVIEPAHQAGLPDERAAVVAALDAPTDALPLRAQISPEKTICIVHTDITRAAPTTG